MAAAWVRLPASSGAQPGDRLDERHRRRVASAWSEQTSTSASSADVEVLHLRGRAGGGTPPPPASRAARPGWPPPSSPGAGPGRASRGPPSPGRWPSRRRPCRRASGAQRPDGRHRAVPRRGHDHQVAAAASRSSPPAMDKRAVGPLRHQARRRRLGPLGGRASRWSPRRRRRPAGPPAPARPARSHRGFRRRIGPTFAQTPDPAESYGLTIA